MKGQGKGERETDTALGTEKGEQIPRLREGWTGTCYRDHNSSFFFLNCFLCVVAFGYISNPLISDTLIFVVNSGK